MAVAKIGADVLNYFKANGKFFLYYAKSELTPPRFSDFPEIKNGIVKIINGYRKGTWKQLTVKEGFLNTLVATECLMWFYIGECIGKRNLIGYSLNPK